MSVTTALVGFIFVCIILPHLVKNKPQFYISIGIVLAALLLRSVAEMIGNLRFMGFVQAVSTLLEAACFILLILATGGLSLSAFAGEMGNAFEVMRRGETEKTVIVPLTGEQPKRRDPSDTPRPPRQNISDPNSGGSIPMD